MTSFINILLENTAISNLLKTETILFPRNMCQIRSNRWSEGPAYVTGSVPLNSLKHHLLVFKFQTIFQKGGVSTSLTSRG